VFLSTLRPRAYGLGAALLCLSAPIPAAHAEGAPAPSSTASADKAAAKKSAAKKASARDKPAAEKAPAPGKAAADKASPSANSAAATPSSDSADEEDADHGAKSTATEPDAESSPPPLEAEVELSAADKPPRPNLPEPEDVTGNSLWQNRIELGAEVLYAARPLFHERAPNAMSYDPGVGFGIHLRWEVLHFLRFHPYYYNVEHPIRLPRGSLSTASPDTISRSADLPASSVATFAFGARLEPTLWLNDRTRLWLAAGAGWGRVHLPAMTVDDPVHGEFTVDQRGFVFVEFPLSIGVGVEIIKNWLALEYEVTGCPVVSESGRALESVQAVDASGKPLDVGPLESLDATFTHTLGLSLIL